MAEHRAPFPVKGRVRDRDINQVSSHSCLLWPWLPEVEVWALGRVLIQPAHCRGAQSRVCWDLTFPPLVLTVGPWFLPGTVPAMLCSWPCGRGQLGRSFCGRRQSLDQDVSACLCKIGRLTSLRAKQAVKNARLCDLFNFSRYASLYCKSLKLAVLVCQSIPKLEY